MENPTSGEKAFYLWVLLAQAKDAIHKARNRELDKYNITTWRSAVFVRIEALGDKATPAQISRWLLREPHSTSELLTRMEKEGLVKRVKDLDKKNMVRVVITEKGHELRKKSRETETLHNIMSCLSEEECRIMWSCLKKLRDRALQEIGIEEGIPFPPPESRELFRSGGEKGS